MNIRRRAWLHAAVLLGSAAWSAGFPAAACASEDPNEVVVVVWLKDDVPAGAELTPESIEPKRFPREFLPADALLEKDVKAIFARKEKLYFAEPLPKSTVLCKRNLSDKPPKIP